MPASCHSAARVSRSPTGGAGSAASASSSASLAPSRGALGAGSASAWATARRANTKHSLSELEASRLAPCRPVHEDSPTAYNPGNVECACRSATIPPIV